MTIPASYFVNILPAVIAAGGAAVDANALVITKSTRVPIGTVASFPTALAVSNYFGPTSTEAQLASIYFAGFQGCQAQPGAMLFAQKNAANVAAYLRGINVSAYTLAQLQSISGTMTITVNGTTFNSATINLSSATSFSNAATIIQAGFTSPNFTVTYDSISGGFVFTSNTTGATSTISYGSGTLAYPGQLGLTQAAGAVISQGAAIQSSINAFMTSVLAQNQNWVTFMSVFDPDGGSGNTTKQNWAQWATSQNNRFIYVAWDTDTSPATTNPATSSLGYLLTQQGAQGTAVVWGVDATKAAFICGIAASISFTSRHGRTNFAYRTQAGLVPEVTDPVTAANLQANGYNFYGAQGSANPVNNSNFLYPGNVIGPFNFLDSMVNEIWLNSALQAAILALMQQILSFPYAQPGYDLLHLACSGPISQAVTFGAIVPGVPLSTNQIAAVNYAAGVPIDAALTAQGWYLQILPATPAVREARGSPPMTLWYCDGGSINAITMNSVAVL